MDRIEIVKRINKENIIDAVNFDSITPLILGSVIDEVLKSIPVPAYKIYSFQATQMGADAPQIVVKENTLGEIVWSRSSTGSYIGTLQGAFVNMSTVLQVFFLAKRNSLVEIKKIDDNTVSLKTGPASNSLAILTYADNCLTGDLLTLKIYN